MKLYPSIIVTSLFLLTACSSDSDNNDTGTQPTGDIPSLGITGSQTINLDSGESFSLTVSSTDPNGDTVTLTADGNDAIRNTDHKDPFAVNTSPATFVNGSSGVGTVSEVFSWTPASNDTGTFYVTFTAMDNSADQNSAEQEVTLQVQTDQINNGNTFYHNNCTGGGCHGSEGQASGGAPSVVSSAKSTIDSAIQNNIGGMGGISTTITGDISAYLCYLPKAAC